MVNQWQNIRESEGKKFEASVLIDVSMGYDMEKEEVEMDSQGNIISVYYDDELVYHEHLHCYSCGWTGEIEEHGRQLKRCPQCGETRRRLGLQEEVFEDGAWMDAKDSAK